ncbi:interferon-induced GTP-binding protein Mx-like [Poecilia reticulata]|uniref:interferon-induced GTP-binding protein Mx-like n=1 Tax=Poecilia reticulata TaxID=8081 RepID=UPI0004A2A638|nr:PREDICTED: interferon-induced GTP-binding protein Mx-like [Poecilia reticulata]
MATLNQQYEKKVRPYIDLIDSLRSLGVEKDLNLPAIAVIGDQSSGKTSVLEALSGVVLPRGSGIITRCPLELKMKRRKEGQDWYGKISYQEFEEELNDPAIVEKIIREAQDEMAGVGVGICDDLITLEIASPDVPDLTLIDLPGIARVAVKGQPENITDQIKRLIDKFIRKQETIILVVVPSNVDIATTEALKMAQQVDPDGERTLGILTKPDLVDKGTEETVVEIVNNKLIQLKKGYMIVKCRGQKEITEKVSLTEAIEREKDFFKNHPYFHTLYNKELATIPILAKNLTIELVHHIEKSLPGLEEQIDEKLKQTQMELDRYGDKLPSDSAERLVFLTEKVTAFIQDVISLTTGDLELKTGEKLNVFPVFRREFGKWKAHLDNSEKNFNRKLERKVKEYEEKYRGRKLPDFNDDFEVMVKEQIRQLEEPAIWKLKDVKDAINKTFFQLAHDSFSRFSNLLSTTTLKIQNIMEKNKSSAELMLRTQFKMEVMVYSQDKTYSNSLSESKKEEEGNDKDSLSGKSITHSRDNHARLQELMEHFKSCYKIAGMRLADQIPMVIHYEMLQQSAMQLQKEMLQILEKKKVDSLLMEKNGISNKRDALQKHMKCLMQVHIYLMEI